VTPKAEQRRAEIIDAAFDMFSERGYAATGIADIAARLHMSHGTFYRYFENKRDILDHVITNVTGKIADAVAAENAPDAATTLEEYREQVRRIVNALAQALDDDPRVARVLLVEAMGIDPELDARLIAVHRAYTDLTALYLENGIKRGYLRADLDAPPTARALIGMVFAAALDAAHGEPTDRERFIKAAMRVMFDGIRADDHPG
jgi:AcrR family transcriptional regulator